MGNNVVGCGSTCSPVGQFEFCGCANGVAYVQYTSIGGGTVTTIWVNSETGIHTSTRPPGFLTGSCQEAALVDVLKFSATAPTATAPFATPKDGDTTIVTEDGTENGELVSYWRYEADTAKWYEIKTGADILTVTVTAAPPATGNVGGPRLERNALGEVWFIDSAGVATQIEKVTAAESTYYSMGAPLPEDPTAYKAGDTWYVTMNGTGTVEDAATAYDQFRYDGSKWVQEVYPTYTPVEPGIKVWFDSASPDPSLYGTRGDHFFVTTDGTPAGQVLEEWIRTEAGVWVEITNTNNAMLKFGTTAPSTSGSHDGEEWFVTSDGTSAGDVLAQYVYDKQSDTWVLRPAPEVPVTGGNVFFDGTDPSTATIFDDVSPPGTDDPALHEDSTKTYWGEDGSVWVWNGTAYVTKTYSFPTHQVVQSFTATAGQTVFTLSKTPVGAVWGRRNTAGKQIAFTNVGPVVTYTPANNDGMTMDAGDWVEICYEAY